MQTCVSVDLYPADQNPKYKCHVNAASTDTHTSGLPVALIEMILHFEHHSSLVTAQQ